MTKVRELSGHLLALALFGALVLMVAVYAGYWYLAQQMAWWTFALGMTGAFVFWEFVKELFKELRK